jgi:hypothetical protein
MIVHIVLLGSQGLGAHPRWPTTVTSGREGSEQSSAIQSKMVCAGEDQKKQCELTFSYADGLLRNGRDQLPCMLVRTWSTWTKSELVKLIELKV